MVAVAAIAADDTLRMMSDHERELLKWIVGELRYQRDLLYRILAIITTRPNAFRILQCGGNKEMPILGIAPGATGVFTETPLPAGTSLPSGVVPAWTSSDPKAVVTPTSDGTGCSVAVDPAITSPNFTLSVTATLPDGTTPSANVTVPVNFPEVNGFTISQTS